MNETCRNRRSLGFYDLSLMKFDLVILVDFFEGKKKEVLSFRFIREHDSRRADRVYRHQIRSEIIIGINEVGEKIG